MYVDPGRLAGRLAFDAPGAPDGMVIIREEFVYQRAQGSVDPHAYDAVLDALTW